MDIDIEEQEMVIPLDNYDDDNDDEYEVLGSTCNRDGSENVREDFDPEELEREWQREREDVDNFHQHTSVYPNPPSLQPRQLFDD